MHLTYQHLRNQSILWFEKYVAPFSGIGWNSDMREKYLQLHLAIIDELEQFESPVSDHASYLAANLLLNAQLLQHIDEAPVTPSPFPSVPLSFPLPDTLAFASLIPPQELIDFLYFGAAPQDSEVLVKALSQGLMSPTGLVSAHLQVAQAVSAPPAGLVLAQLHDQGDGALPDTSVAHPGLDTDQLGFLVGLYIAAFGRAPEYEGLMYWADSLAGQLAGGASQSDSDKAMARDIYWAGEQHRETGTTLDDAQYIEFVYASVLGRDADTDGFAYWLKELGDGISPRAEFLTVFLRAALDAPDDAGYLQARIQVALHAAQQHLSGPGSSLDLHAILSGVTDASSAYAAIVALDTIGTSLVGADTVANLAEVIDAQAAFVPLATDMTWMLQTLEESLPEADQYEDASLPHPVPPDHATQPDVALMGVPLHSTDANML